MSKLQWLCAVCAVVAVAALVEATEPTLASEQSLGDNAINNDIIVEDAVVAAGDLWSLPSTSVGAVSDVVFDFENNIAILASSFGVSVLSLETGKVVSAKNLTDDRKVLYDRYSVEYAFGYLAVAGFANNNSKLSTIVMWSGFNLNRDPVWVHRFEGTVYGGVHSMELYQGINYYLVYSYMNSLGDAIRRPPMPGGSRWLEMRTGKVLGAASLFSTLGEVFASGEPVHSVMMDREYDGPDVNLLTRRRIPSGDVDSELMLNNRTVLRNHGNNIVYISDVRPRTVSEYQFKDGGKFTMNYGVGANEELLELAMTDSHRVAVSWDSNPTTPGYRVRIFAYTEVIANVLIPVSNKAAVAPIATLISTVSGFTQQDLLIGIPGKGAYYMSWTARFDVSAPRLVYTYNDTCGFASVHLGRNPRRIIQGVFGAVVVNKREGIRTCRPLAVNAFAISS